MPDLQCLYLLCKLVDLAGTTGTHCLLPGGTWDLINSSMCNESVVTGRNSSLDFSILEGGILPLATPHRID